MEHSPDAAEIIVAAMERAERSQKWTATKAGIAPSTFMRKIRGGGDFTLGELARIARALGVRPADLLPAEFAPMAVAS